MTDPRGEAERTAKRLREMSTLYDYQDRALLKEAATLLEAFAVSASVVSDTAKQGWEHECKDGDRILSLFPHLQRTEGGWLPVAKIVNEISDLAARCKRAEGTPANARAVAELQNIANAERFNRERFRDDTEFADWAVSRCKHAIAATLPQPEHEFGRPHPRRSATLPQPATARSEPCRMCGGSGQASRQRDDRSYERVLCECPQCRGSGKYVYLDSAAPLSETPAGGTAKVPVEPTAAMLEAAGHACDGINLSDLSKAERSHFKARKRWHAMLAAAPSPDGNDNETGGAR